MGFCNREGLLPPHQSPELVQLHVRTGQGTSADALHSLQEALCGRWATVLELLLEADDVRPVHLAGHVHDHGLFAAFPFAPESSEQLAAMRSGKSENGVTCNL